MDDGIYILETKGPEFRVAHGLAIENIYGEFDPTGNVWVGDPEMILDYFGNAPIFTTKDEALEHAVTLEEATGYLEYGICLISEFKDKTFADLVGA